MKYILIQNDGEVETNSFELIGASTKRNDNTKIGFFGSGLKYSIAYMMRNNIEFKIYSGLTELKFTTKQEQLKDQHFDRILINDKPTSYTVTMGATWTQDWFVLREIYCNAIDESNCQLIKGIEEPRAVEGKTRIFISITEDIEKVINNWGSYFSEDREPLFEAKNIYTSSLGNEDCGGVVRQRVMVYDKTEGIIFRKGIRVSNHDKMLFDYGFDFININEDRTAKATWGLDYAFSDMATAFVNEDWLKSVLRTSSGVAQCKEYMCLGDTAGNDSTEISKEWVRFSEENMLVVEEISSRFAEDIAKSKREVFLLPSHFAKHIKRKLQGIKIIGMGKIIGNSFASVLEKTPKTEFLLREVIASLQEMKYQVHYDIEVVEFEDNETLGQADIPNKKILLSTRVFDMGRREIAMTLMEENEHIFSGQADETRAFQNHIFSNWLKMIEEANGLFL